MPWVFEMISRTSRYALQTLGYLAQRPGAWVLRRDVAAAMGMPPNYIAKVLSLLRKHGLLESQKGWGGGFRLRDRALSLPIGRVLEIIDGASSDQECVFALRGCDASRPCPMHEHWERVRAEFRTMVSAILIRDLAATDRT